MNEVTAIFCRLAIAVLIAISFIFLKRMAYRRRPSLEDSSDVAWALLLMSIGSMTGYSKGWVTAHFATTIAWNVLFASILLLNRRRKVRACAESFAAGNPASSTGGAEACAELLIGIASVAMAIR